MDGVSGDVLRGLPTRTGAGHIASDAGPAVRRPCAEGIRPPAFLEALMMALDARIAALHAALRERILVLDGATGSLLQTYGLGESDFRGTTFAAHPSDLQGNNDLLCLTRPDVVRRLHDVYLEVGADIVETNTFNANPFSQADYG
ncbi:MAG: hypothetical protein ACI8PZ_004613, partial [Myxococcota bacterium]